MDVRLDHQGNTYQGDLNVRRVTWRSPALRQYGEAELFIERSSPVWSPDFVDEHVGGMLVTISHGVLGIWRGIALKPAIDAVGMTIPVMEFTWYASRRPVTSAQRFKFLPAGVIARAAVNDALVGGGQSAVTIGPICECPPLIPEYTFAGQPVGTVLSDLQQQSGQEWSIDPDGVFSWTPPAGALYEPWLTADADVYDESVGGSIDDFTGAVKVLDSHGRPLYTAGQADPGLTGRVLTITIDSQSVVEAARAAEMQLAALRYPTTVYRCKLRGGVGLSTPYGSGLYGSGTYGGGTVGSHTAIIREGDYVKLVLPYAGLQGASPLCRVLARSFADGQDYVDLELQEIRPYDAAEAALAQFRVMPAYVVPVLNDLIRQQAEGPGRVGDGSIEGMSADKLLSRVADQQVTSLTGAKLIGTIPANSVPTAAIQDNNVTRPKIPVLAIDRTRLDLATSNTATAGGLGAPPATVFTYLILQDNAGNVYRVPAYLP